MITEQAAAGRVAAVLAERDAIQANLLELDGSFAKRVLEGATLTGQTRDRWAAAAAALAGLWETFLAYSAVVDRVAVLGRGNRRQARKDLPELSALLTEGCVQLAGPPVPLARRDLAAAGRPPVTLATAVGTMRRTFAEVTAVTSAVESVWAAVGAPLEAATAELARCATLAAGLGADIEAEVRQVATDLAALRAACNADPLALWHPSPAGGRVDTSAADRLSERAAALAVRIAAAIDKRDELRGLLRAYRAKAGRLGVADDAALAARHERAHDLLWTGPVDLAAAEAAVAAYQHAILATEGRR